MFSWLVMNASQKDALLAIGVSGILSPKPVTAPNLSGKWASPISLLDDPKYAEWAQGLSFLPLRTMSADALFA